MNTERNKNTVMHSLYTICLLALFIHVILLLSFAWLHVLPMVWMNVVSVLCYAVCFFLIKKGQIKVCIYSAFVEILLHTVLAILCVGTGFGFQLYFINSIAIMFFADYFSVYMGNDSIGSLKLGIVCCILYVASLIVPRHLEPIYSFDPDIAFIGMILNSLLTLALLVLFFNLLTKTASIYERQLKRQAIYDNLTGLANRHHLIEHIDSIFASGNVDGYWLAILDIDDFKGINDRYGHLCGDFVLKRLADLLESSCTDCIVSRWGGEEFMVVGRTGDGTRDEDSLLENIRRNIEAQDFVYEGETIRRLTVTIGKANYQAGQTLNEWFSVADNRLYSGKLAGKNRVVVR